MVEKIRVLIVDDHSLVVDGIKSRLQRTGHIEVVGEADNGVEGIALAERVRPDIVLMDINMPEMNGIVAAEILADRLSDIKLLVLSIHDDREYILDVARLGARGYLLKSASAEEMVTAINTVYNGGTHYSREIAEILLQQKHLRTSTLTNREQMIISLLAAGMSSKQMASELSISVRTVETHRRNIKQKLNIRSTPELVRYAIEFGLVR
jgi:two-component system nitrate/nitrite response regulator NarL